MDTEDSPRSRRESPPYPTSEVSSPEPEVPKVPSRGVDNGPGTPRWDRTERPDRRLFNEWYHWLVFISGSTPVTTVVETGNLLAPSRTGLRERPSGCVVDIGLLSTRKGSLYKSGLGDPPLILIYGSVLGEVSSSPYFSSLSWW